MASFEEARRSLLRALHAVFPDAQPVARWSGVEAWGAPRPEAVVDADAPGTYDPRMTVVGIADRKSGPVIYFLDPGDYFALETHKELLTGAGFKLGRGCIMHTRKAPLPTEALETLFRRVKTRDAKAAKAPASPRAPKATTTDEYLAALPDAQRTVLERLRKQIRAAAPEAEERFAYGMPGFGHKGPLVYLAAFRDHCSLFPASPGVIAALKEELKGFEVSKGTIRFTPTKPLPAALVKRIVKLRVAENEARAAARKARRGRGDRR